MGQEFELWVQRLVYFVNRQSLRILVPSIVYNKRRQPKKDDDVYSQTQPYYPLPTLSTQKAIAKENTHSGIFSTQSSPGYSRYSRPSTSLKGRAEGRVVKQFQKPYQADKKQKQCKWYQSKKIRITRSQCKTRSRVDRSVESGQVGEGAAGVGITARGVEGVVCRVADGGTDETRFVRIRFLVFAVPSSSQGPSSFLPTCCANTANILLWKGC